MSITPDHLAEHGSIVSEEQRRPCDSEILTELARIIGDAHRLSGDISNERIRYVVKDEIGVVLTDIKAWIKGLEGIDR